MVTTFLTLARTDNGFSPARSLIWSRFEFGAGDQKWFVTWNSTVSTEIRVVVFVSSHTAQACNSTEKPAPKRRCFPWRWARRPGSTSERSAVPTSPPVVLAERLPFDRTQACSPPRRHQPHSLARPAAHSFPRPQSVHRPDLRLNLSLELRAQMRSPLTTHQPLPMLSVTVQIILVLTQSCRQVTGPIFTAPRTRSRSRNRST